MQNRPFTIIELSGHIIDSLTLAKVIDRIQAAECNYQINDLQIGQKKNDMSTAQISLWPRNTETLNALLLDLKAYGVYPLEESAADMGACPADKVIPAGAYVRFMPPMEVQLNGQWQPVDQEGDDLIIVVNPQHQTAQLKKIAEVKQGDLVVMGKAGVRMLPMLGESLYVQSAAK
jgi:hypothetical protein